jgi:hypothetical protein
MSVQIVIFSLKHLKHKTTLAAHCVTKVCAIAFLLHTAFKNEIDSVGGVRPFATDSVVIVSVIVGADSIFRDKR